MFDWVRRKTRAEFYAKSPPLTRRIYQHLSTGYSQPVSARKFGLFSLFGPSDPCLQPSIPRSHIFRRDFSKISRHDKLPESQRDLGLFTAKLALPPRLYRNFFEKFFIAHFLVATGNHPGKNIHKNFQSNPCIDAAGIFLCTATRPKACFFPAMSTILEPTTGRRRLPEWLRLPLPQTAAFAHTRNLLQDQRLHTVCESARCPNHWECWSKGTATFMIGGDRCTRACKFCAVTTAKPLPLDPDEPQRVAEAARRMGLRHVVITGVARDDLPDGGAAHFRQTIEAVRQLNAGAAIEVLTPDFQDRDDAIRCVLEARPDIFNHNLETVRRLTPVVRHRATYERSLSVLRKVKQWCGDSMYTKSGLMLGLGETEAELREALADLRDAGCDLLTLGQYLQPTPAHLPVVEYIPPARFAEYGRMARAMGFLHVSSAPLVRSSYHADDFNPARARSA